MLENKSKKYKRIENLTPDKSYHNLLYFYEKKLTKLHPCNLHLPERKCRKVEILGTVLNSVFVFGKQKGTRSVESPAQIHNPNPNT